MAFNNEIEKTKKEIEVLTAKLALLKEMENHKTPCEIAYKDWWGEYPTNIFNSDDVRWMGFQAGYNAAYEEKVSQEPEENEWKLVALKLGEKLSDNGPGGYYDFTPGEWFEWALNECKKEEPEENEWKSVALRFGEKLSGYLSDGYYELSPAAWFRWAVFTYGKGQQIKDAARESVRWCEENPEKSVEDYLTPKFI